MEFFYKKHRESASICRLHWKNASDTVGADFPHVNVLLLPKQQQSQVTAITKTPKNLKHQTQNPKHKTKKNKALNPTSPKIQILSPKR